MIPSLRHRSRVVAFLLIEFIVCMKRVDSAQNGPESQQQFAQAYVAALQSHDPTRVNELMHPQVLACKNAATQEFFASGIRHEFDNVPGLRPRWSRPAHSNVPFSRRTKCRSIGAAMATPFRSTA
jgi:hypothetical protein